MTDTALPTPAHLFDLRGKVALVTGASRGLGWAMARALGAAGATVILNARDSGPLQARAQELTAGGVTAEAIPLDVGAAGAADALVAQVIASHGRLDILVSNVGGSVRKPFTDLTEEEWQQVLTTGVTAGWRLACAAAPAMRAAGQGRMIFVSSIMAKIARPDTSAYVTAKAGLEGLVRSLAVELAPDNITANAIAPGYFLTAGNAALRQERPEFQDRISMRTAMGRWGDPDEIMTSVLYLASGSSSYTTGSVLMLDGGMTATI